MGWLFGDRTRVDKPPVVDRKVIAFPRKHVPAPAAPDHIGNVLFTEVNFQSVDDVLQKARKDIRNGLISPTAIIMALYDQERRKVIWYQFGREDDEANEAFTAWLDDQQLRNE